METPYFFFYSDSPFNCLNDYKNFVILHKEIFEKKKKVGKNKFYNEQKQVKKSSR
jgi:hypothetical protein